MLGCKVISGTDAVHYRTAAEGQFCWHCPVRLSWGAQHKAGVPSIRPLEPWLYHLPNCVRTAALQIKVSVLCLSHSSVDWMQPVKSEIVKISLCTESYFTDNIFSKLRILLGKLDANSTDSVSMCNVCTVYVLSSVMILSIVRFYYTCCFL